MDYEGKWMPVVKDEDNEILQTEYRLASYLRKILNLDQPERSKREDMEDLGHEFVTVGCTDHRYCTICHEEDHVIKSKMMRCSELGL